MTLCKTRNTVCLALLVATLLAPLPLAAQTLDKARLDRMFDTLDQKQQAMGSLLIVKDGAPVYGRIIGYAQVSEAGSKPLTAASEFRIGSITKTFTAAMIFQLIEEGRLKLTDTLDHYYPQVPNAAKITIGELLSHYGGVPDAFVGVTDTTRSIPVSKAQVLDSITKGTPVMSPGARQVYSNSGYILLGFILEDITGKPYAQNLKERVSDRIGLPNTYVATGPIDPVRGEALSYRNLGGWKGEPETHPSLLLGAGAIVSTPADLARFAQALFDLKLVSQASLTAMKTTRPGDDLGMGLETTSFNGRTFYGHSGGADNYGAWLAYQPEEKLAFAYATNAKVYPVPEIEKGLVGIYYGAPFQLPNFDGVAMTADALDRYAGTYGIAGAPVRMAVTRKDGGLSIAPPGESAAPLTAMGGGEFRMEGANIGFTFDAEKGTMTMKRPNGETVFVKDR